MPQELLIALIAAGAALAGSLLGSFLTRTTEHKQWLRNKKQDAYVQFMQLALQAYSVNEPEDSDRLADQLIIALTNVRIHGTSHVFNYVSPLHNAIGKRLRQEIVEDAESAEELARLLSDAVDEIRKDLDTYR